MTDRDPWPAPRGNGAGDRTSRVPLSGKGRVRWRVPLPDRHLTGVSVAANGRCFATSERGILALDGPDVRWSAGTVALRGSVLLGDGLMAVPETGGLVVREQETGAIVYTTEVTLMSDPVPLADGLLVYLASHQGGSVLRASTPAGEVRWEARVDAWLYPPLVLDDHVVVTEGEIARAFDRDGRPVWSAGRHEFRTAPGVVTPPRKPGEVDGPPVGLPGGGVLVPIRSHDVMGYLVIDPRRGAVRPVPAHLWPGAPVVPLHDPATGRELLVLPGWPRTGERGEPRPAVTVVDLGSGTTVLELPVPDEIRGMVAGAGGLVAVAGGPSWERWLKYHGWPGYDLRDHCYVRFLGKDGAGAEWRPGRPVTGPLAVGADGDVLVPLAGELVSVE